MVPEVYTDDAYDERLARRLKRRNLSSQQFSRNSCRNNARKNAEIKTEVRHMVKNGYLNYINNLSDRVDSDRDDGSTFVDHNNGVSRCKRSDEYEDPEYKMFLQYLVQDGRSYVLQFSQLSVKYEEEEKLSDGPQSSLKNCQERQNIPTTRNVRSVPRNEKVERREKSGTSFDNKKNSFGNLNTSSRRIKENPLRGNLAKKSKVPVLEKEFLHSVEGPCKSDLESDMIDEDYKVFLADFLYADDRRCIFTPVDGRSRVFECDSNSTSDSEREVIDLDSYKPSCTSIARKSFRSAIDVDTGKYLQSPATCNHSSFRERLMQILKKPYIPNEFNFFLNEINCRRAQRGSKDLRSGSKDYIKDSFAQSYLELYNELAMKIKLAGSDRPKVLNLLRGFFYWLQNLSHDGAFQPWMDSACLNVLPQS